MKRALVFLALLALAHVAYAATLQEYAGALAHMRALLVAHQIDDAKLEADNWRNKEIVWSGGRIHSDDSLLAAIANTKHGDRQLLLRIDTTLAELRASGAMQNARVDPKLLQRVAAEQNVPELAPGGEVKTKLDAEIPLLERIAQSIADAWEWLSEKIRKFLDWLIDLFPRTEFRRPGATAGMSSIVYVVVGVIVLLLILLAYSVARRSKAAAQVVETSAPFGSKRDEDPLSRGATEWERYAAQLAAAGRYREAIRAWYHAVLVTCYSAGVLHFRKGRTNWEYVAMLAPSLPWRAEMIELTRRFEREWYGADESSADALEDCASRARAILEDVHERGAA
ncbi:MAG TPA: DUF4129 domain-containing protein [Thermoanaerobaculia bacterium]|nr:DUF4129 domain-containing protein [Thermoanaerobaculia bacterium]